MCNIVRIGRKIIVIVGCVTAVGIVIGSCSSGWFEVCTLSRVLIANVLLSRSPADGEPLETPTHGFNEVPGIECISESTNPEVSALICGFGIGEVTRG